jgi:hypothetical protein
MDSRDDLEAALIRIVALEDEVASLRQRFEAARKGQLDAEVALQIARQNAETEAAIARHELARTQAVADMDRRVEQATLRSELDLALARLAVAEAELAAARAR